MAEQELAAIQIATLDELTGLSNRRGFMVLARHALQWCQRQGNPATLLYMDLDEFKSINDRFGHAEGDLALKAFAHCLMEAVRGSDVIARLGGDEFLVLLTDSTPELALLAVERLQVALEKHNQGTQRGYELKCSVGRVQYEFAAHQDLEAWLKAGDQAMYEDKRQRKLNRPA
jgi:diguanylate cyclase (GGDEF)-like protein